MPSGYLLGPKATQWVVDQYQQRSGTSNAGFAGGFEDSPDGRVLFRNDSAFTVPPFGICRVSGYAVHNGRNVLTIDRPFTTQGDFIINGKSEVEQGQVGTTQLGHTVSVAFVTGETPSAGQVFGVNGFKAQAFTAAKLAAGCHPLLQIVVLGSLGDDTMFARIRPYETLMIQAPNTSGIPGRANTLLGSAACKIIVRDTNTAALLATANNTLTVYNWTKTVALTRGNRYGMASYIDGKWFITAEDCNDTSATTSPGVGTSAFNPVTDAIDLSTVTPASTVGESREITFSGTGTGSGPS